MRAYYIKDGEGIIQTTFRRIASGYSTCISYCYFLYPITWFIGKNSVGLLNFNHHLICLSPGTIYFSYKMHQNAIGQYLYLHIARNGKFNAITLSKLWNCDNNY
jgi:hypothetical protein